MVIGTVGYKQLFNIFLTEEFTIKNYIIINDNYINDHVYKFLMFYNFSYDIKNITNIFIIQMYQYKGLYRKIFPWSSLNHIFMNWTFDFKYYYTKSLLFKYL